MELLWRTIDKSLPSSVMSYCVLRFNLCSFDQALLSSTLQNALQRNSAVQTWMKLIKKNLVATTSIISMRFLQLIY